MIGKTISHYKIVSKLGEGGMGVVYKANDLKLGRMVALKFLPPHTIDDKEQRQRLEREARAVSSLDHPNVCTVYEIDTTPDGRMFISMAFYDGVTLKERLGEGQLPLTSALRYSVQIARGLAHAHKTNLIHRDIKPANIILTNYDQIKVLDFGLAKLSHSTGLTRTGATMGTIAYMSPEQAKGGASVDHRTDIWSLGVMMYEMIAGQRPFNADFEHAVVYFILNEEPEPLTTLAPDVPSDVAAIVDKAMAKRVDDRYASMEELLAALEPWKLRLAGESPATGTVTRITPPKKPKRKISIGGLVGLVAALAIAAFFFFGREGGIEPVTVAAAAREATRAAEQRALVSHAKELLQDDFAQADALMTRAQTAFDAGRYDKATALFEEAASKFKRIGDVARQVQPPKKSPETKTPEKDPPVVAAKPPPIEPRPTPTEPKVAVAPDRSADIRRAKNALTNSKRESQEATADALAPETFAAASKAESEAVALAENRDFDRAIQRFGEAGSLYRTATKEAKDASTVARKQAETLQIQVRETRTSAPADYQFIPEYQSALKAEQAGDTETKNGRFTSAVAEYRSAAEQYAAAGAVRERDEKAIKGLIDQYRRALEAENLDALALLHTNFTAQIRDDWSSFFGAVNDLRADLALQQIEFREGGADGSLLVKLRYSGARGSDEGHQWNMIMSKQNDRWLVAEVRRES